MVTNSHRYPTSQDYSFPPPSRHATTNRLSTPASVLERLMHDSLNGQDVSSSLPALRQHILLDGIDADESGMSSHRVYVWLVLLCCPITPYSTYADLLARGASPSYSKINNDTFRTLATDPLFARRVSQNSISRLLNTVAWTLHDAAIERSRVEHSIAQTTELPPSPPPELADDGPASSTLAEPPSPRTVASSIDGFSTNPHTNSIAAPPRTHVPPPTYLQGMNVLAAPFLYASRSEPQAYTLLSTLLQTHIPSYITPSMTGVHKALSLLSRALAYCDPALNNHLTRKNVHPETYAFASVLTLSACTPPLSEVLILWDFYFARGVHLNVLAVVAQLTLMRDKILSSDNPGKELRTLPHLQAKKIIALVVRNVSKIKDGLWDDLVTHTEIDGKRQEDRQGLKTLVEQ